MPDRNDSQRRTFYDQYWETRDRDGTPERSRERARETVKLLGDSAGRRLLEVGCGPGWGLETFKTAGFQVRGVDVSEVAVEEARRRGVDAQCVDIEAESLENIRFQESTTSEESPDVIVALEVLEHLVDPVGALGKMIAVLAPGGTLVVSLPNEIALPARLQVLCGRLPFGGHHDPHIRHFDRPRSRELFRAASLEMISEVPINLLPPRWTLARRLVAPLVRWVPGLFSLATIYRLESRAGGSE